MGHHHKHDHEHYYDHTKLYDNQHVFLKHYIEMLETCKQGIHYILNHQADDSHGIDLQMIQDCIQALHAIQDANILAKSLMKYVDQEVYDRILSFDSLTPELKQVISFQQVDDMDEVAQMLIRDFFPKFLTWSETVKAGIDKHVKED